jgi:hypothetical protein
MINHIGEANSTNVALANGETFTGKKDDVTGFNSVVFSAKTDTNCKIYADFSVDGENWDSTLTFEIAANVNEVHRLTVTRKFFRLRITNDSGVNQTYLRAQCIYGNYSSLTSPLNSQIQSDADTLVVRALDFNLLVAEGLYQNRNITIKDGLNLDIDTGSVPEDLWDNGGVYTGFPTGAPEEGQIVVAGADTGTVYYSYMATSNDTDYVFATKAIAGAGNYDLGHNIYRCNFMYFVANSATVFNVGLISLRHKVTTANVFCTIPIGFSQSFCAAYTVPAGSEVYVDRFFGNLRGSATGSVDGYMWYRPFGESPRLRFPFELNFGTLYFDDVDYTIRIPEKVDFIPRVIAASANNLSVKYSYRIIKVK